jgi:hypothetical protein
MTAPPPGLSAEASMIISLITAALRRRTAWGEDPALCHVHFSRDEDGGRGTLVRLPVPDAAWAEYLPEEVLSGIAGGFEAAHALTRCEPVPTMIAAAFRSKAWLLKHGLPGTAERSEAAAALSRQVYRHSDRVEARLMYAVDRAGTLYIATKRRGHDQVTVEIAYPGSPVPGGDGVPAALRRLAASVFGGSPAGQQEGNPPPHG